MKHYFTKPHPTRILGLTVTLLPEGQHTLAGCILEQKSGTIIIEQQWPQLLKPDDLRALLKEENIPLVLALEGRGILHKATGEHIPVPHTDAEAVALILPTATASDFHVQRNEGYDRHYITIVRRETISSLTSTLKEWLSVPCDVIAIEAGPFSLQELVPFLGPEWQEASPQIGHYAVTLQKGRIAQLESTSETRPSEKYPIGEDMLTPQLLLAYASALRVLLGSGASSLAPELLAEGRDQWQQKLLFRRRGIAIMSIFLGSLLVNFWLFLHLTAKNQALTARSNHYQKEIKTLETLRQTVQQQQKFLQTTGWLAPSRQSVYSDQLAATVPEGLQLTSMDLNPADEAASRLQQQAVFIQNVISIEGKCREAQSLNLWLQALSRLPWVKHIQKQNFAYDYAAGIGTFSFTILLPSSS